MNSRAFKSINSLVLGLALLAGALALLAQSEMPGSSRRVESPARVSAPLVVLKLDGRGIVVQKRSNESGSGAGLVSRGR